MGKRELAVIILAAGQGTRMKSERAKVLHELCGEPLLSYPVQLASSLKAARTVVVVGHQADRVREQMERLFPGQLSFAVQAEQKGTAHAVRQGMGALRGFDGLILILSGDVPFLRSETVKKTIALQQKKAHSVVAVTMRPPDPTGYGRILRDDAGSVVGIVEHKDASPAERAIDEVNAGIYACDAAFLRKALQKIGNDNAQGEYYLTDIVAIAARSDQGAGAVIVDDPIEVEGVNHRAQLASMEAELRRRINREHMLAGVTIVDPSTTYIGRHCKIGRDTIIHAGVHIRGKTKIGTGCSIDTGSVITDAIIHDDVEIHAHSIVQEATVRSRAIIGPFARLRPLADVHEEAHVGNFVELKKTKLGKGAKANHLAYLGDASIGPGSNIGAGTITCNYDGYGKYLTEIGRGVFVGSNSTLVAPLKLGNEVYVAAGSTLTEDVRSGSLVLGRARQVEKQGRGPETRDKAKARAAAARAAKGKG